MSKALMSLLTSFFMLAGLMIGQAITGSILGTVTDASGALVRSVKITIKNIDTGLELSTTSNNDGDYTFPTVPPGTYEVSARLTGFRTAVTPRLPVEVQKTSRMDFTLSPGSITEQVVVTAEAPLVQSTTSDLGH